MADKSPFMTFLRLFGGLFPGDRLKTSAYLNLVHRPRRFLRNAAYSFYRMDHIYDVISEFRSTYSGNFSILEFGVADGYAFTKKLYASKYLGMEDRIVVHGFDTFEGMPATADTRDQAIVGDGWVEGQFKGNHERLSEYCERRYKNFRLHKGFFSDTLTPEFLESLRRDLPMLIWIDCDYYTSTRSIFERLIPYIPTGCVIYFDEYEFNYGSRFTGEARVVHEMNQGAFGEGLELVLDRELSLSLSRVYRFINVAAASHFERLRPRNDPSDLRRRSNDSPFP